MFTYRSRFLARGEVWYDDEPGETGALDWILYYQCSRPIPGAKTKQISTFVIDLALGREQLQANLNKDTAYKIRRARERDRINCERCNPRDPAVLDRYEQMYNAFAEIKGLTPLNRARMASMAAAGVLDLSVAKGPDGEALVYHANYRDSHRATSMELPSLYRKLSDSAERNFISRASRYLTWNDILRYQEEGLKWFDFGGWYRGTDPAMLKINDFKRGFGGEVVNKYECEQVLSLKGRAVLNVAVFLNRVKRSLTSWRPSRLPVEPAGPGADAPASLPASSPEAGAPAMRVTKAT